MHLLTHRISLTDGDEEPADIQAVNTVVFTDHRTANVVQIQRTHDVQSGSATRCFYGSFPTFGHPSISQLSSLRWVDTINKQDWLIASFTFQLVVVSTNACCASALYLCGTPVGFL